MSGHVVTFGEVLLRLATPGHKLTVQCDALDMVVGGAEQRHVAALGAVDSARTERDDVVEFADQFPVAHFVFLFSSAYVFCLAEFRNLSSQKLV